MRNAAHLEQISLSRFRFGIKIKQMSGFCKALEFRMRVRVGGLERKKHLVCVCVFGGKPMHLKKIFLGNPLRGQTFNSRRNRMRHIVERIETVFAEALVLNALRELYSEPCANAGKNFGKSAAGNIALYVPGVIWLGAYTGAGRALALGFVPFVIGDGLKIAAGWGVLSAAALAGRRRH